LTAGKRNIQFEEGDQRLKVVLPSPVNWPAFALHTLALIVWMAMLLAVVIYLLRGLSSTFVLTVILLGWILVWLWFGRFLWTRWQYHAANREILFIDEERLIVRRPVSILGLTSAYDMAHIDGLYYSEKHRCPAFDYAYQHVYFGRMVTEEQARIVIDELNRRYFPNSLLAEASPMESV
jgi:hypothetical protein